MIFKWFGRKKKEEQVEETTAPEQIDETSNLLPHAANPLDPQPAPEPEPAQPEVPPEREPTPIPEPPPVSEPEELPTPDITPEPEPEPIREPEPEPDPEIKTGPMVAAEPVVTSVFRAASEVDAVEEEKPKKSWFTRLKEGLSKSSSKLTDGITGIFTKRKLDDEALEELEELLITADLGPTTAAKVTAELARTRFGKEVSPEEVKSTLSTEIAKILSPVARPLVINPSHKPHVILLVGVNGTGKTTTIGKLARQLRAEGKSVMLAAGDTFRAAAVSQLTIWGERTGCQVISRETGADAAGLAFDALEQAKRAGVDVLLIDTAGRLQNKTGLMDELRKIVRVIKKVDATAPHDTLLTLDATTGQNAHNQVEVFGEMVNVSGLILTKLDGSARGGVLVSLAERFKLPVHAIGVGEGVHDLRPFEADAFARSLMGIEKN